MPPARTWLPQFPRIVRDVDDFPAPHLDRDAVKLIFGLKHRATLLLMKEVGPSPTRGGAWVVSKATLLGWLANQAEDAGREIERKKRFSRAVLRAELELPRKRTSLLTARLTPEEMAKIEEFPAEVTLIPGEPHRLIVEFTSIEMLGERLLAVGIALNKNLDRYMDMLETPAERTAREADEDDAKYIREWLEANPMR